MVNTKNAIGKGLTQKPKKCICFSFKKLHLFTKILFPQNTE